MSDKPDSKRVPNPGSKAAKMQGCTCPDLDNAFGRGAFNTRGKKAVFVMMLNCPLHGRPR